MSESISTQIRSSLQALASADLQEGIKQKFVEDNLRADIFGFDVEGFYIDFSKTYISNEMIDIYVRFADEINFNDARHRFFSGGRINSTENRAVLHTLLRDVSNQGIITQEPEFLQQAEKAKNQFFEQYSVIQEELGKRMLPITDIIHVGIGGSSLGTRLLFEALVNSGESKNIHFVGNIDAHQLVAVLEQCSVESTLVIGVSKTFTTTETLQNLDSIGNWFTQNGVAEWLDSVYAVTANPVNASKFGVPQNNIVSFPEWVGGRYSVWSSVSLSAALVLGLDKFKEFLAGAATMDQHFYQAADPKHNICFIAAMLDHYYGNFMNVKSRAIFAYDYRLRSLVDYLQQLETESNGKDRQSDGSKADQQTSPVVWGGVGTDVQHSVFQMLHQGTSLIPSEFILVKTPDHEMHEHHTQLLANGLAQTAALLAGQNLQEVCEVHAHEGLSELTLNAKIFSGDRPSTTLLLERLTPAALGSLLAFYEHRTFCYGIFTNINSYDQMGVELGKRLAKRVKPLLESSASLEKSNASEQAAKKSADSLDPSTLALVNRICT